MLVKAEYRMQTVRKLMIALFFIGYFCFFGSIKAEAAWSNNPKALTSSWKKCGSRSARLVNGVLYISAGGKIIKKEGSGYGKDTFVNKAYYDNNYIVYFMNSNYGYQTVRIYSYKENWYKFVLYDPASGIQDLLGFFKGYVYYLTRNDSGTSTRAYRIPIKSYSSGGPYANMGDAVRIPALDQGGGGIQYKNYLYVMGYRGDPSPTFLKVYNLKNGKCKTLSTACTSARIISGKLYYSVTKGYKKMAGAAIKTISILFMFAKRMAQRRENWQHLLAITCHQYWKRNMHTIIQKEISL